MREGSHDKELISSIIGVEEGKGAFLKDTVTGIAGIIADPLGTIKGIGQAISHPKSTVKAMVNAVGTRWENEVTGTEADTRSRAKFGTEAVATMGSFFIGVGEVKTVVTGAKVGKIVQAADAVTNATQAAKVVNAVDKASDAANLGSAASKVIPEVTSVQKTNRLLELDLKMFGKGTGNIQTGGRNNLSVDEYFRREAEASKMYDNIRASTSDVQGISKNTGIAESRIQRIKDHVFNNEHIKSSGNGRFDPDYEIAQAWTRLQQGTYNTKDIDLLNHELFESRFEGIFKTNYETAHDAAVRSGRPWEIGD